jgi:hypothetical protein
MDSLRSNHGNNSPQILTHTFCVLSFHFKVNLAGYKILGSHLFPLSVLDVTLLLLHKALITKSDCNINVLH